MLLTFLHIIPSLFSAPDDLSVSDDMIPGRVKSIKVSGVYGEGDYDLSTGIWKYGATSTYVIELKDAPVQAGVITPLTDKTSALMMIPQDFGPDAKAKVSMVFNDGAKDKTVSFSLKKTSWKAGNHITYVLSSSKITTLKMGDLTYPKGWNSVNDGATYKIRKAYDEPNSSVDAGLFVVNDENKVIAANVQLTYDGNSWSLPADSKLKFSPKYNYFVYYPYQANLAGLPVVNNTPISDASISSSTQFFAKAIANWNIATDQSTLDKMNACDLQIGKAKLDDDGCSVSFEMEHAMGLAILNRESKSVTKHYILSGYPSYTWDNGTTTLIPSATLSNSQKLYATTNTQGVKVIPPSAAFPFSSTSKGDDAWSGDVNITAAANGVGTGTAKIKATKVDYNYTMAVGDIYYSDGAMTHQSEDLASGKTPVGIVGYITMNNDGNYWTEKDTKAEGIGGHALVMSLKSLGSSGKTDIGTQYRWINNWRYYSGLQCVNTKGLIIGSYNYNYGSGYYVSNFLRNKWGDNAQAAYYALEFPSTNTNKNTGWFLATAGQYYAVLSNLGEPLAEDWPGCWTNSMSNTNRGYCSNNTAIIKKINEKMSKVGDLYYTEFMGEQPYIEYTSSEFSTEASIDIGNGLKYQDIKKPYTFRFYDNLGNRTFGKSVRPFLAF